MEETEKKREYFKQYYNDNREKLKQMNKNNYNKNRDRCIEYGKNYYENHKEDVKKKYEENKQTLTCECGCEVLKVSMKKHKESKKHNNILLEATKNKM
jgi:hypothetical protein